LPGDNDVRHRGVTRKPGCHSPDSEVPIVMAISRSLSWITLSLYPGESRLGVSVCPAAGDLLSTHKSSFHAQGLCDFGNSGSCRRLCSGHRTSCLAVCFTAYFFFECCDERCSKIPRGAWKFVGVTNYFLEEGGRVCVRCWCSFDFFRIACIFGGQGCLHICQLSSPPC
jgi:hypothetical protein